MQRHKRAARNSFGLTFNETMMMGAIIAIILILLQNF